MKKIDFKCPFHDFKQQHSEKIGTKEKYELCRNKIKSLRLLKNHFQKLGITSKIPCDKTKEINIVHKNELDIISNALIFQPKVFNINSKIRDKDKGNEGNMFLLELMKKMKKRKMLKNHSANSVDNRNNHYISLKKSIKMTLLPKQNYSSMNITRDNNNNNNISHYDTVAKMNMNNSLNGLSTTIVKHNTHKGNKMNNRNNLKPILYSNFPIEKSNNFLHKSMQLNHKMHNIFEEKIKNNHQNSQKIINLPKYVFNSSIQNKKLKVLLHDNNSNFDKKKNTLIIQSINTSKNTMTLHANNTKTHKHLKPINILIK